MKPATLKECFETLDILLSKEDQEFIKNSTEDEIIITFHHSLGRYIRNEWGLWTGGLLKNYFEQFGLTHADDMSSVILTSYWRLKHNKPISLDQQVKKHKEYWEGLDK